MYMWLCDFLHYMQHLFHMLMLCMDPGTSPECMQDDQGSLDQLCILASELKKRKHLVNETF
jgi:hypothetical protein